MTEGEWISKSKKGELCGVLGCMHPPTSECPKCRNHYCSGHLDLHVHKVADEGPNCYWNLYNDKKGER